MNLDKYDHLSERLPHDATIEQRFAKFEKIVIELKKHGIQLIDLNGGCPVVGDDSGWRLTHNSITWEIYRVIDVVDMVLNNRINRVTSSNH